MSDRSKLVVVRSFNYSHEAEALRGMLEAHGVQAFLQNEFVSNTFVIYGLVAGGVKVVVPEEDLEEALRLIGDVNDTEQELTCPNCGSHSIEVIQPGPLSFRHGPRVFFRSLGLFLFMLFSFIGFPYRNVRYQCGDCGKRFSE